MRMKVNKCIRSLIEKKDKVESRGRRGVVSQPKKTKKEDKKEQRGRD
jgi:hypothetical protein